MRVDGPAAVALVLLGLGTFVGVTILLVRRRSPRPAELVIPRSWRVAGWFVWCWLFFGGRGLDDLLQRWYVDHPLAVTPVAVVVVALVAAGVIWVGGGLAYFGDPRAPWWALAIFVIEATTTVGSFAAVAAEGGSTSPERVVIHAVYAAGGLIAVLLALRTPVGTVAVESDAALRP